MVATASAPSPCAGPHQRFRRHLAVVLAVDAYQAGIPALRCAVSDGRRVAEALGRDHHFDVQALHDAEVTTARVRELLERDLPAALGRDDRLLFYFAGHGVAVDADD